MKAVFPAAIPAFTPAPATSGPAPADVPNIVVSARLLGWKPWAIAPNPNLVSPGITPTRSFRVNVSSFPEYLTRNSRNVSSSLPR